MEWLDIVDESGAPTGARVAREDAHRLGVRHRTAHLWLARRRGDTVELLLQLRSHEKDSNPDRYDISSAGHIPAGVDWIPSALRELKEELGLEAAPEELIDCGVRSFYHEAVFHGQPFRDRQVSRVYLLWRDVEPDALCLQTSEVAGVRWMEFGACLDAVRAGRIPNCIDPEELELLRQHF